MSLEEIIKLSTLNEIIWKLNTFKLTVRNLIETRRKIEWMDLQKELERCESLIYEYSRKLSIKDEKVSTDTANPLLLLSAWVGANTFNLLQWLGFFASIERYYKKKRFPTEAANDERL